MESGLLEPSGLRVVGEAIELRREDAGGFGFIR
jgi:hypothetical protein